MDKEPPTRSALNTGSPQRSTSSNSPQRSIGRTGQQLVWVVDPYLDPNLSGTPRSNSSSRSGKPVTRAGHMEFKAPLPPQPPIPLSGLSSSSSSQSPLPVVTNSRFLSVMDSWNKKHLSPRTRSPRSPRALATYDSNNRHNRYSTLKDDHIMFGEGFTDPPPPVEEDYTEIRDDLPNSAAQQLRQQQQNPNHHRHRTGTWTGIQRRAEDYGRLEEGRRGILPDPVVPVGHQWQPRPQQRQQQQQQQQHPVATNRHTADDNNNMFRFQEDPAAFDANFDDSWFALPPSQVWSTRTKPAPSQLSIQQHHQKPTYPPSPKLAPKPTDTPPNMFTQQHQGQVNITSPPPAGDHSPPYSTLVKPPQYGRNKHEHDASSVDSQKDGITKKQSFSSPRRANNSLSLSQSSSSPRKVSSTLSNTSEQQQQLQQNHGHDGSSDGRDESDGSSIYSQIYGLTSRSYSSSIPRLASTLSNTSAQQQQQNYGRSESNDAKPMHRPSPPPSPPPNPPPNKKMLGAAKKLSVPTTSKQEPTHPPTQSTGDGQPGRYMNQQNLPAANDRTMSASTVPSRPNQQEVHVSKDTSKNQQVLPTEKTRANRRPSQLLPSEKPAPDDEIEGGRSESPQKKTTGEEEAEGEKYDDEGRKVLQNDDSEQSTNSNTSPLSGTERTQDDDGEQIQPSSQSSSHGSGPNRRGEIFHKPDEDELDSSSKSSLSPKGRSRKKGYRVSFQPLEKLNLVSTSIKEESEDIHEDEEFNNRRSSMADDSALTDQSSRAFADQSSRAFADPSSRTMTDHSSRSNNLDDSTGHGSVASFAFDDEMSVVSNVAASQHKRASMSFGRRTKNMAKSVAKAPVNLSVGLAKGLVRQPKKLAKGAKKRLARRKSSGATGTVDIPDEGTGNLTEEEYKMIAGTIHKNFIFQELFDGALNELILSFEKFVVQEGHILVTEGDDKEDYVYVISEGTCSVAVDGVQVPGPYGTLKPKSIFGELGVIYNQHKAATIKAQTKSVVLFRATSQVFFKAVSLMTDGDDHKGGDVDLKAIDKAIDQLSGAKSLHSGEIMRQYQPNRLWLWKQWNGTILEQNLLPTLVAMALSVAVVTLIRYFGYPTWDIGHAPDPEHPIIQHLSMISGVWMYTMTLTTFILTFYVNQAYTFWQETNTTVRQIQGGISDFMIAIATHANRGEDGNFTPEVAALIEDIGSSARIFHALFWASCAKRFHSLATPIGMASMAQRGMMTPKQLKILQGLNTPYGSKHYACLEWMMIAASQGMDAGLFRQTDALSRELLSTTCKLRGTSVRVTDSLKSGRPPLSYTHLVQILVDSFIWTSPLALYAELGVYSVACVGVITLFYGGLLNMAKIFLDPLGNQHFTRSSINMGMDLGVLTRESNASTDLFKEHGSKVPW